MWAVLVAIGVGAIAGIVAGVIYFVVKRRVDVMQRNLNKFENKLRSANCVFLADLIEDLVVGDVTAALHRCRTFVEQDDSHDFFLREVAMPLALYAITTTAKDYPDYFKQLEDAMALYGNRKK